MIILVAYVKPGDEEPGPFPWVDLRRGCGRFDAQAAEWRPLTESVMGYAE